jgi:hypothetical protein
MPGARSRASDSARGGLARRASAITEANTGLVLDAAARAGAEVHVHADFD